MSATTTAQTMGKAVARNLKFSRCPLIFDLRKPFRSARAKTVRLGGPLLTSSSGPWRIISRREFSPILLLQRGRRATEVWSNKQMLQIYGVMHNENPDNHIYHGFFEKSGNWKARWGKKVRFTQKAKEAIATIQGEKAEGKETMIGFGPFNTETKLSYWGAIDFDGKKDACPIQAEQSAIAALHFAIRDYANLYYVLETSGSGGWHLYLFSPIMRHATEWTAILTDIAEKVACFVGKSLDGFFRKGICEIFPSKGNEKRRCGNAIRALGTYNGSSKSFSEIVSENLTLLLDRLQPPKASKHKGDRTKNKEERLCFVRDKNERRFKEWNKVEIRALEKYLHIDLGQCHIREGHRHESLQKLIGETFPKLGYAVAKDLAQCFFEQSGGTKDCPDLTQHLEEFERCWRWFEEEFHDQCLDEGERAVFTEIKDPRLRDAFRIVRNFALAGQLTKEHGNLFEVSVGSLAQRLGFTSRDSGSRYRKLLMPRIIEQVKPCIVSVRAALFRWVLRDPATFVELARYQKESSPKLEVDKQLPQQDLSPAADASRTKMSPEEIRRIANELARMKKAGALEGVEKEELRVIATTIHLFGTAR